MATAVAAPTGALSRVWAAYLRQLGARPLRTKMITSGCLFLLGDTIAQFGVEGRKVGVEQPPEEADADVPRPWDPIRAARMYGGVVFAPLAHTWLGVVDKIRYASKFRTLATRLVLDQCLWGPFIVCVFWTSNGFLEGKTPPEVKQKVEMAFVTSYIKSLLVFAPTQIINFSIVPLQHRLAVQQTVGLGWNIYLSYVNNINNKRLRDAAAALALAQAHEEAAHAVHLPIEEKVAHAEVEAAERKLAAAKAKRDKIRDGQGGGATGVGTRMGW